MRLSEIFLNVTSIHGRSPLSYFFYSSLKLHFGDHYKKFNFLPGNYYEFGVGAGNSLLAYINAFRKFAKVRDKHIESCNVSSNVYAFDSFSGLPRIDSRKDLNPAWEEGMFSYSEEYVKMLVGKKLTRQISFRTIKGYFEQSLTEELRDEIKYHPPSIVTIDADLYTSTKFVLEWLAPILQNGTLIFFDDIWEYLGNPNKGEMAAILEFNSKGSQKLIDYYQHGIPALFGRTFIYNTCEK